MIYRSKLYIPHAIHMKICFETVGTHTSSRALLEDSSRALGPRRLSSAI
jgi:hypothetical protein